MTKKLVHTNFKTIVKYLVEGITTETENEIIDFCDNANFGGCVKFVGGGRAYVEVFTD